MKTAPRVDRRVAGSLWLGHFGRHPAGRHGHCRACPAVVDPKRRPHSTIGVDHERPGARKRKTQGRRRQAGGRSCKSSMRKPETTSAELKLSGPWRIECWRFSPDDTWLAVGLGFIDPESERTSAVLVCGTWRRENSSKNSNGTTTSRDSEELPTWPSPRAASCSTFRRRPIPRRGWPRGTSVRDVAKATGTRWSGRRLPTRRPESGSAPNWFTGLSADLRDWTIACWAFSPDNKWVASGSGYVNGKLPESLGKIDLWKSARGGTSPRCTGSARSGPWPSRRTAKRFTILPIDAKSMASNYRSCDGLAGTDGARSPRVGSRQPTSRASAGGHRPDIAGGRRGRAPRC